MLLCTTSCTKPIDGALNEPLDYALQVIPDIHEVMPRDLVKAMTAIPDTVGGQPVTHNALHFGDNPPSLVFMDNDTLLGFMKDFFLQKVYIPVDSTCAYASTFYPNKPLQSINCFLFHDQHRGVAKYDFKENYIKINEGPNNYAYETAHLTDSVFIMGEGNDFTAYYTQKRSFVASPNNQNPNYMNPSEYVILSGTVTATGIKNLFFGKKIKNYDNPDPILIGNRYPNINDILIYYKDFVPFAYWDPNHHYNN